jgi:hypothetical protein
LLSYLDLPILSPDPEIASLYASKSGTKRIFLAAKVDIPPSEFDIYSLPQVSLGQFCGIAIPSPVSLQELTWFPFLSFTSA